MSTSPPKGTLLPPERLSIGRPAGDAPRRHDVAGVTRTTRPERPASLVDGERRVVQYLRLSVTDRCNFRCQYCMPEDGVPFVPRPEILDFEEVARLVAAFASLGINRVRLTGGEPLLRRDLTELVRRIAAVPGVEDLALSTNAFLFAPVARELKAAGVTRVNISIDTLRPDRFAQVTRTGTLDRVLAGIDAAVAEGYAPVKLNAVVLRGFNDDELGDLVRYAGARGVLLRFIEYMPIGVDGFWSDHTFMSTDEMIARLGAEFDIAEPRGFAPDAGVVGGGPARYARVTPKGGGPAVDVGFISALSHNFCSTCNRVRVTATGALQECLAFPGTLSLRDAMRAGASDPELVGLIEDALFGKGPGHRFDPSDGGVRTFQPMSFTGG
ncbi:MAG: GTP 3',8-cyclase MoaA [Deltaproteobacteria bacterium]|nr:MAG: GTP 3',8-cyclase MoaA [Deltaproteobacteria bacterium]